MFSAFRIFVKLIYGVSMSLKNKSLIVEINQFLSSNFDRLFASLPIDNRINREALEQILMTKKKIFYNPNVDRFFSVFKQLPIIEKQSLNISNGIVSIDNLSFDLTDLLIQLNPWRKGPFKLGATLIDSEWQSQLKWDRFSNHYSLLSQKRILDIGCGNGYYMYRMLEHNPKFVLGIDPSDLTFFQYHAIHRFIHDHRLHYLPIGFNDLSPFNGFFDVVFCMGIMYHHRSPVDLFKLIRHAGNDNLTLFFDTIIIDGDDDVALFPNGRYAQMPNVYFIPTLTALKNMLKRGGFNQIDILSVDQTTVLEQRVTSWTFGKSLEHFLDPNDNSKTIEGYPAPKRVALIAT